MAALIKAKPFGNQARIYAEPVFVDAAGPCSASKSEIEHLNGYFVRRAAEFDLSTPANPSLLVNVKFIESAVLASPQKPRHVSVTRPEQR